MGRGRGSGLKGWGVGVREGVKEVGRVKGRQGVGKGGERWKKETEDRE